MRILFIGAGAVGGYFAARLTAAGRDVTLLVRPARAAQLRADGLQLLSTQGDITVHPKLLLAGEMEEPFDLVIVATKSYSLDAAMDDFAAAVGPATMILPLLNGMRHIDTLVERFGEHAVLGGATRINADLDGEGRIHQDGPLYEIVFGERDRSITPRVRAIEVALAGCGFDVTLSPDILAAMWAKWVMLSSLAAATCLLRGTVGEIAAARYGTEIANAIVDESVAIAAANGYPQNDQAIAAHKARITTQGSTLSASMFRDLSKNQPVEADHVLGDFLARARNAASPLIKAAYVNLSVYAEARGRA
jgi:2-dehydropantoate 2-reductase